MRDPGVTAGTGHKKGRDINASADVLDAIGRALHLTEAERVHLHLLAGLNPPRPAPAAGVPRQLRHLVDAWAPRPAILRDRYWNLLAVNESTRTVFGLDESADNCLVAFFTHRRYRDLHPQWAAVAPSVVAAFRADAAHDPGDPGFARVVARLSAASPEFAALWAWHDVGPLGPVVKAVRHPEAGDLFFDLTRLTVADRPDLVLDLYVARPAPSQGGGAGPTFDALCPIPRRAPP